MFACMVCDKKEQGRFFYILFAVVILHFLLSVRKYKVHYKIHCASYYFSRQSVVQTAYKHIVNVRGEM